MDIMMSWPTSESEQIALRLPVGWDVGQRSDAARGQRGRLPTIEDRSGNVGYQPCGQQHLGFKSGGSAQNVVAAHVATSDRFDVQSHLISPRTLKSLHAEALADWRQVVAD